MQLSYIFAVPKRGRPTPGFSIFIRSFIRLFGATFVSLDQILVPAYSLRDKGTKKQSDKGTKGQRDKGRKGQREKGTKGQREKGKKGQRDKGTKGQKDKRATYFSKKSLKCCVAS